MLITPTVEHVAWSIAYGLHSHNYARAFWTSHVREARSALLAIKEPTPEMMAAVAGHIHKDFLIPFGAWWEVAIEAGLGEGEEVSAEVVARRMQEVDEVLKGIAAGGRG
jgi:hypothetical protein